MLGLDMLRAVAGVVAIASMSAATNGAAQEFPSPGKTIMMQIGFNPGGGTDAAGLLIAKYLKKYLPNDPSIALQHMPGPGGMTALNHVVLRTPPDGMLTIMGGASALDPFNTRKANAKYDPTKFRIIGGIGRGGSALVITAEGEKPNRRLSWVRRDPSRGKACRLCSGMAADPDFLAEGERISDGFFPVNHTEVERYIKTLADTPDEAIDFTTKLMQSREFR